MPRPAANGSAAGFFVGVRTLSQQRVTLKELARAIEAEVVGPPNAGDIVVTGCAPVDEASPGDVGFIANPKYVKYLQTTKATAVIVDPSVTVSGNPNPDLVLLRCRDPYFGY